jgi:S1-C subfamily serine protease/rhodanese-related sulfurtransferase
MRLVTAALVALGLVAPAGAAMRSIQEAILVAKPAVALVTAEVGAEVTMNCGTGPVTVQPPPFVETGTAWFIDGRGWLITNAHVVDPVHRLPPWVTHELKKKAIEQACVEPVLKERRLMPGERPDFEERVRREATQRALPNLRIVTTTKLTVTLSNGQSLPVEVKKFSAPLLLDAAGQPVKESGRDLALLRVKDGAYPALTLMKADPKIGDSVHVLGFPGVVGMHELLARGTAIEASVTNGSVSGFRPDAIGQDVVQTDAPAAHGNSGGPAIATDASVLGVMTFITLSSTGSVVQGFNFLIPARDVQKFVANTGVKIGESAFTPVWVAGLDALFTERYSTAVSRLSEANAILPNLADVRRALKEAEEKVKDPPPRPFPWAWATLGVTLVSVGVYGGMLGRRWWKNRFRILPGQVIGLIERGMNPVLVDARSKTDFETSPLKLPGATRLSPEDATSGHITLDNDPDSKQMIVVYCTSPGERTSEQVSNLLRARGFRNIRILKGGLGGWTNARLPVESKIHLPSIGVEIYRNLSLGDIERRRFAKGDIVFREGDDARGEAFVIHSGTVEVRRRIDGVDRVLSTMGEGELLGQIALFRRATRSADAVATSDVELLVINNERLDWLIMNRPQLTKEVLKSLSELVVRTDAERGARTAATPPPAPPAAPAPRA